MKKTILEWIGITTSFRVFSYRGVCLCVCLFFQISMVSKPQLTGRELSQSESTIPLLTPPAIWAPWQQLSVNQTVFELQSESRYLLGGLIHLDFNCICLKIWPIQRAASIFIARVFVWLCVRGRIIVGKFVCFLTVFYCVSRNQHTVIHHHTRCGWMRVYCCQAQH